MVGMLYDFISSTGVTVLASLLWRKVYFSHGLPGKTLSEVAMKNYTNSN